MINTYLTGSYWREDCIIMAFILSSSEALASARLAVCLTRNYSTHTLETQASSPSQRHHHLLNPGKSPTMLADVAWWYRCFYKTQLSWECAGEALCLYMMLMCLLAYLKRAFLGTQNLRLDIDLCNRSTFLPSGLKRGVKEMTPAVVLNCFWSSSPFEGEDSYCALNWDRFLQVTLFTSCSTEKNTQWLCQGCTFCLLKFSIRHRSIEGNLSDPSARRKALFSRTVTIVSCRQSKLHFPPY